MTTPTEAQKRRAEELGRHYELLFVELDRRLGNHLKTRAEAFREGYLAACADAEKLVLVLGASNRTFQYVQDVIAHNYGSNLINVVVENNKEALREWRGEA